MLRPARLSLQRPETPQRSRPLTSARMTKKASSSLSSFKLTHLVSSFFFCCKPFLPCFLNVSFPLPSFLLSFLQSFLPYHFLSIFPFFLFPLLKFPPFFQTFLNSFHFVCKSLLSLLFLQLLPLCPVSCSNEYFWVLEYILLLLPFM